MADFGIICEFNPLHGGHQYLLRRAREIGADRIVCIMSGNTVQRGSFAIADAYLRAEAAIRCGADAVLELPFPWSSGSAESFARAGVAIASEFCDTLLFGSESGDLATLQASATVAGSEEFRTAYADALSRGERAAEAYYEGLRARTGYSLSANDLLGVEYLRAIAECRSSLTPLTITREGDAYGDDLLGEGRFPSATAIRRLLSEGQYERAESLLPQECAVLLQCAREEGRLFDEEMLGRVILAHFRLHEGKDFDGIAGCEGGLANRLCRAARDAVDFEGFLREARTKRYTDAHLRRVILYCLCDVRAEDLSATPVYTRLLAADERGRSLLAEKRNNAKIPVITKPADVPRSVRQTALAERVDALFTLGFVSPAPAGEEMRKGPRIL